MKNFLHIKSEGYNSTIEHSYINKNSITRYSFSEDTADTDTAKIPGSAKVLTIEFGSEDGLCQITCDPGQNSLANCTYVEVNEYHRIKRELDEWVSRDA